MKVIMVIDMLEDFIYENGALYIGPTSKKVVKQIKKRLSKYKENNEKYIIIFLCDSHDKDDVEFKLFPKHCVVGTQGAKVVKELVSGDGLLSGNLDNVITISKTKYSGFYNTSLESILSQYNVEEIELCGVCTSICVLFTAVDLVNREYSVIIHKDCVADFDFEAHSFALRHMENILGIKIV